jgi:hypothetical protein
MGRINIIVALTLLIFIISAFTVFAVYQSPIQDNFDSVKEGPIQVTFDSAKEGHHLIFDVYDVEYKFNVAVFDNDNSTISPFNMTKLAGYLNLLQTKYNLCRHVLVDNSHFADRIYLSNQTEFRLTLVSNNKYSLKVWTNDILSSNQISLLKADIQTSLIKSIEL